MGPAPVWICEISGYVKQCLKEAVEVAIAAIREVACTVVKGTASLAAKVIQLVLTTNPPGLASQSRVHVNSRSEHKSWR